MTGIVRPGEIRVAATLEGGTVSHVAIESDRPIAIVAAMKGRTVTEVAAIMASLHGLCGQSHAAAICFGAAAASRSVVPAADVTDWMSRLAAERVGEHLRSLFLAGALTADAAVVREGLAVAGRAARGGSAALAALTTVLDRVGVDVCPAPEPDGADVLRPEDDAEIIAALAADPTFGRAPHLPGRCPQTGPAARFGASAARPGAAQAARFAELREVYLGLIRPAGWIAAGPAGERAGYAAVETPRGRLHYWLVVAADGTLVEGRSIAPTEWNFHPDGPLARALTGWRPDGDPIAAITARAAAFDPCVAFGVTVREAADA